jgi:hypothetical protein
MKYKLKVCCDALNYATRAGSDGEGWGAAMYFREATGELMIGCVESKVTRCPFCGKKIKVAKEGLTFPATR